MVLSMLLISIYVLSLGSVLDDFNTSGVGLFEITTLLLNVFAPVIVWFSVMLTTSLFKVA